MVNVVLGNKFEIPNEFFEENNIPRCFKSLLNMYVFQVKFFF
jgi:hypothetical protein